MLCHSLQGQGLGWRGLPEVGGPGLTISVALDSYMSCSLLSTTPEKTSREFRSSYTSVPTSWAYVGTSTMGQTPHGPTLAADLLPRGPRGLLLGTQLSHHFGTSLHLLLQWGPCQGLLPPPILCHGCVEVSTALAFVRQHLVEGHDIPLGPGPFVCIIHALILDLQLFSLGAAPLPHPKWQ